MSDIKNTATIDIEEYNRLKNFYDTIRDGGTAIEIYSGRGHLSHRSFIYGDKGDLNDRLDMMQRDYDESVELLNEKYEGKNEEIKDLKRNKSMLNGKIDKYKIKSGELINKNQTKIIWIVLLVIIILMETAVIISQL